MSTKYPQQTKKKAIELYESGLSVYKVAQKLKVTAPTAVYSWVKKAQLSRTFHQYDKKIKESAKVLYCDGLTSKEVAKELGLGQTTVLRWMRNIGLSRGNGQCKGSKHYLWKGGVTSEVQKLRKTNKYKKWRWSVFVRDNFTCQRCGQKGGKLNAHHILSYIDHPKLQLCLKNGVTYCEPCHKYAHRELRNVG